MYRQYEEFGRLISGVRGKVIALFIDVSPSNAEVYINGHPYGPASGFAQEPGRLLLAGRFEVWLDRAGYRPHRQVYRTDPGERHFIRGSLIRNRE